MERQMMPEYGQSGGDRRQERGERAGTTLEISPDALRGLGLPASPQPGESFELTGRALCRGLSRRGGAVMQMDITAMRPVHARERAHADPRGTDGPRPDRDGMRPGYSDMEARKAFFRSLFNEDD